jgi:hypothetical protein
VAAVLFSPENEGPALIGEGIDALMREEVPNPKVFASFLRDLVDDMAVGLDEDHRAALAAV